MKKIFLTAIVALCAMTMSAQDCCSNKKCCNVPCTTAPEPVYTNVCKDKKLIKRAEKWLRKGEWRHGFTKADPHFSVNVVDFYNQYQKDPKSWGRLFEFLQNVDLQALPKGTFEVNGTKLRLSVQDSKNGALEKRSTESHLHHIDFQWCIRGTERFGIIDHKTSTPNCKYKPDVIHYNYDKCRTRFYDSEPDEFFIFFPGDWHIAKINNDTQDQNIRVLVVKVDWID